MDVSSVVLLLVLCYQMWECMDFFVVVCFFSPNSLWISSFVRLQVSLINEPFHLNGADEWKSLRKKRKQKEKKNCMAIGLTLNELYVCNKSLEPNNKDNKNGVNNINHKYISLDI